MLKIENISFQYAANEKKIFDNLSLNIHPEKFYILLGASGSGKSTLFKILTGELIPKKGRVMYTKNKSSLMYWDQQLQEILCLELSIFENYLLYHFKNRVMPWNLNSKALIKTALEYLSSFLKFNFDLNRPVSSLSGGQRQKLALALICLRPVDILLLDEPTSALDFASAQEFIHELRRQCKKNRMTTIMITHDQALKDVEDEVISIN